MILTGFASLSVSGCRLSVHIDEVDIEILKLLKENARIKNTEIAKRIGINESTVRKRIEKLEKTGYIKGYTITLGKPVTMGIKAFILVQIVGIVPTDTVIKELSSIEEIQTIWELAGSNDLQLYVECTNPDRLNEIINIIRSIDGVKSTETTLILREIIL